MGNKNASTEKIISFINSEERYEFNSVFMDLTTLFSSLSKSSKEIL